MFCRLCIFALIIFLVALTEGKKDDGKGGR